MDESRLEVQEEVTILGTQVADGGLLVTKEVWEAKGNITFTPEIAHGMAFCSVIERRLRGHSVLAVDLQKASRLWKVLVGEWSHADPVSPLAHEDMLYIGTSDGTVVCLRQQTGETVWRQQVCPGPRDGHILSPLTIAEGLLLVGTFTGEMVALDVTTGEERWRFSHDEEKQDGFIATRPVIWRGSVVYCTWIPHRGCARVHCVKLDGSQELWWIDVGGAADDHHASPLLVGDVLFLPGQDGYMRGLDLTTRELDSLTEYKHPVHTPVVLGSALYWRSDEDHALNGYELHSDAGVFPDCVLDLQTEHLEPYELSAHDGRIYCPSGPWLYVVEPRPAEGIPTEYGICKYHGRDQSMNSDIDIPIHFVTGLAHDGDLFCAGTADGRLVIGFLPDPGAPERET
jgi:hypothetical protein